VRKWIARDDWPFPLSPPWDVGRVQAWAEIHLNPDPAAAYRKKARAAEAGTGEFTAMGPLTKARLQATIERALLVRQRRLIEAGKMHDVEDCRARRRRHVLAVRNALSRTLPRALAAECVGRTRGEIQRLIGQRLTAVCDAFAAGIESDDEA